MGKLYEPGARTVGAAGVLRFKSVGIRSNNWIYGPRVYIYWSVILFHHLPREGIERGLRGRRPKGGVRGRVAGED